MTSIAFPAKDPSTGQLATRVDREVPRLETALRNAEESADGARSLAVAGVLVGALGLLTAAGALVLARGRGGGPRARREPEPLVSEMARPNA